MTRTPGGTWLPSLGCPALLPQPAQGWGLQGEVPALAVLALLGSLFLREQLGPPAWGHLRIKS